MRLLIAEDDIDLAEALSAFLVRNQYRVDCVHDGTAALEMGRSGAYDGIILDIMMPGLDGITVLKTLRSAGLTTPIMMLTAKGEKEDRIVGFNAGADDYVPKPFAPDELLARVRAMLRRSGGYTASDITFGDLTLSCDHGLIRCGSAEERLSAREYQVLELFMRTPRTLFSAEKIMERVWGWDAEAELSVVWVHISNLRKKLKAVGSRAVIKVSRGLGYMLEEEHEG